MIPTDRETMILRRKRHADKRAAAARYQEAIQSGEKFYTGVPCPKNHKPALRYTSTKICVECQRAKDAGTYGKVKRRRSVVVTEPYTAEQQRRLDTGALKYYGVQCSKGHDGLRYAGSNKCVHCQLEYGEKHRPPAGLGAKGRRSWKREREKARDQEMWALVEQAKKTRAKEERAAIKKEKARPEGDPVTELLLWIAAAV